MAANRIQSFHGGSERDVCHLLILLIHVIFSKPRFCLSFATPKTRFDWDTPLTLGSLPSGSYSSFISFDGILKEMDYQHMHFSW